MRNLLLAGAAGLALALAAASAYAIPRTDEIMSRGGIEAQDQGAVGAFLPLPAQADNGAVYAPPAPREVGGQGANTGASVGGTGSHR